MRLEAREVRKAFGPRTALHGASVVAEGGEVVVVLGPSGAGKSTLLRILASLLEPDAGEVRVDGAAVGFDRSARARVGWVGQKPVVFRQTAAENVALGLRTADAPDAGARVRAAMERLGIWGLRDEPARRLSGGEQQRIAFARAAVRLPDALVLDEFTANLDPANVRVLEDEVRRMAREGAAVVAATHDLAQARRLADTVALLIEGRIVERSPAKQFFDAPGTPEARAFLAVER